MSDDWRQAPPPRVPVHPVAGTMPPAPAAFPPAPFPPAMFSPAPVPWRNLPPLPQQPTSYVQFLVTARWRWWLGLILAFCLAFGLLVIGGVPVIIALAADIASGRTTVQQVAQSTRAGTLPMSPGVFLANNVGLALMIPWCMLMTWACTGQRPRWLSSVVGGLRWKWLFTIALLILPVWLITLALDLSSTWSSLVPGPDTVLLIVGIVLTQPLQAAGEEYFFRGLFPRIIGAWIRPEKIALAVAWVSSSAVFMLVHAAGDIYLNLFYFSFGMIASWLTWRSGGLEAAIAIHVVNNLISMVTVPFSDLSKIFDRGAGTVTAAQIVPTLVTLVAALVITEVMIRRRKPVSRGPVNASA